MGKRKPKAKLPAYIYVVFSPEGHPKVSGAAVRSRDAWNGAVLWHFGSIYGKADYRKKKRKFVRSGYVCRRMVYG